MDLDFDEVQGTGFKESLLSALRNSIAQEFSAYLSNGVMECSNFVEAVLSPGSVVAEVNINLGSDASPSDASSLEEDLDSLSTESVEERLLAGMGENRPRILAAGTSKSDLEHDSDSDGNLEVCSNPAKVILWRISLCSIICKWMEVSPACSVFSCSKLWHEITEGQAHRAYRHI
ncbi:hypothetical protein DUNSADRAFT_17182 [Dunaliella salina]|uniref:Encoded protein n=1 Tax=Dunaliella salina TaxID=3046 RepID=A0ABQ7G292_DUNSA|nr:hypothetical protein DUNSADRAFT_17182 [Dunaliella salina]|eukprot:KAF5828716.1 hypothetical protein DUNSADRAFT_17182 [Dunaliella salina]